MNYFKLEKEKSRRIVLITHNQFGYQTDFFKYAHYLRNNYKVIYICLNQGRQFVELERVDVHYVKLSGNKIVVLLKFILVIFKVLKLTSPNAIVIKYFPFCSILLINKLRNNMLLSIQTASVTGNSIVNFFSNSLILIASRLFRKTAYVSQSLKERLFANKGMILPVGADSISNTKKSFQKLKLVYLGTLNNRDIDKTINGIWIFKQNNPNIEIEYSIIGTGNKLNIDKIQNAIKKMDLESIVNYVGYLSIDELIEPFSTHNVGVAFVPITKYYDKQPPTKTFEYIMSGMAVIATNTYEHRNLINKKVGVLVEDNANSFAAGIESIYLNRNNFDSSLISNMFVDYSWENIICKKLIPIITEIFNS